MSIVIPQELEGMASENPTLYTAFVAILNQLNQTQPSFLSGTINPEGIVPAQVGTTYIQQNGQSGPTTIYVKDTGNGNTGWSKLGAFGSIPPAVGGGFQYTSTTNSITWYWDGTNGSMVLTIYRADGTTTQVPASNITINGLTPGTTYLFYPYFDERTGSVKWVAGNTGNVAVAFTAPSNTAAQQQALTTHIPMSSGGMSAATTSSGTGGGSGGGGGTGGNGGGGGGNRFL